MLRDTDPYTRSSSKHHKSSKLNKSSESLKDGSSSHSHRKTHSRHHHGSRHSTTSKHLSPKSARHKSPKGSSCHGNSGLPDITLMDTGKGSPPPKLLKMSHQRATDFNNDDGIDSVGSSSPGVQEVQSQLFDLGNSAANLRSMNSSDCSTSPESEYKNSDQRMYGKYSGDSTSGISSMSSGGSDASPNSYTSGDKERERSLNGESTDPGSDGSSPLPSVISNSLQSNFQTSLSTVLEINTLPVQIKQEISGKESPVDNEDSRQGLPLTKSDSGASLPGQGNLSGASVADKSCLVCGDKATGYHFNALTCEGCKGFFRRNSQKLDELRCSFSNNCNITKVTRRHCQACRLNKCFQVGMLTECIMTEEQKVVRKMKNTDKHNQAAAAQHEAAGGISHPLLSPNSNNQPDPRYSFHNGSQKRSRSNSITGLNQVPAGPGGAGGDSYSGGYPQMPNYQPPNQEQLALMEELSIEYHNLYSKRATVEDVISNVPHRPQTMDSSPIPSNESSLFCDQQDSLSAMSLNPNIIDNHNTTQPSLFNQSHPPSQMMPSADQTPLTIISPPQRPPDSTQIHHHNLNQQHPSLNSISPDHHNLLMPAPPTRPVNPEQHQTMLPSHIHDLNHHQQSPTVGFGNPAAGGTGTGGGGGGLASLPEAELSKMCRYLAAITSNRLERCVAFCQRMPGFQLLSLHDKMSLLKSGAFEILLLRSSIFMDSSMDKIKAGSFTLTPEMLMRIPYLRPFVCPFFTFISKFKSLNCDLTELLLLIGVVLFSPDRPGVQNKDAISNIQQVYADTLQAYLSTKYCQAFLDNQQMENNRLNRGPAPGQPQMPGGHSNIPVIKSEHPTQRATCGASLITEDALISPTGHHQQRNPMMTNQPHSQPLSKLTAALISPTSNLTSALRSPSAMLTKSRTRLGSLMMQVCTLRSVNFEHSQSILQIDVKRKEDIGPFLREMLVASNLNGSNSGSSAPASSTAPSNQFGENSGMETELPHDENTVTLTTL